MTTPHFTEEAKMALIKGSWELMAEQQRKHPNYKLADAAVARGLDSLRGAIVAIQSDVHDMQQYGWFSDEAYEAKEKARARLVARLDKYLADLTKLRAHLLRRSPSEFAGLIDRRVRGGTNALKLDRDLAGMPYVAECQAPSRKRKLDKLLANQIEQVLAGRITAQ
jgi:hypothetical protein